MSMLSYFSILGILSSFFCLYAIFYVGFAIDTEAPGYQNGSLLHPQPIQMIGDLDRIPLAIGLTMVAFGGHSVFPSICSSMANKADYPRVLDLSYFIVGLVYGAIELAGYLMYGVATQKEITLNLIATYPGVLTQMVVWTIALNPMSKIAITLHPIALALEEFLLSPSQKRAAARNKPGKTLCCDGGAWLGELYGMGDGDAARRRRGSAVSSQLQHEPADDTDETETISSGEVARLDRDDIKLQQDNQLSDTWNYPVQSGSLAASTPTHRRPRPGVEVVHSLDELAEISSIAAVVTLQRWYSSPSNY
ncbi:unnamed protein product [Phytophthora lilii]|uniref:Unnamed protein product n=1 Tax=Phytophthora lilii TaxID=2077276 RepID=A0A9W6TXC0_9STRA|nr:unnamed protein product [Phytophthora lilii]